MLKRRSKATKAGPPPILAGVSDTTVSLVWNKEVTDDHNVLEQQVQRGWKCPSCMHINKALTLGCLCCQEPRPLEELTEKAAPIDPSGLQPGTLVWQVRHGKPGKSNSKTWASSPPLSSRHATIGFLQPGKQYAFSVRVARVPSGADAKLQESDWSSPSMPLDVVTLTRDHQVRLVNLSRVNQFLQNDKNLAPFPEDVEKDSIRDKAVRATEGLFKVAGWTGVGGKWLNLARNAWNLKRSGVAALIFREEVQQMVSALSSFVGDVGKGVGLSAQDITIGSYYMLWERKRERLVHPDVEMAQHKPSSPGVLETEAPQELVDELTWYSALAHMSYRSTSARLQWVLRHFPSRNEPESFRLVMSNPLARPSKPAFALVAHKSRKIAVLSIRGTKEVDDMATDSLYDAATAPFSFHQGSSSSDDSPTVGPQLNVHQGMLHSAMYIVDGQLSIDSLPRTKGKKQKHGEPTEESQGSGVGVAVAELVRAGYEIVFCGHSLGAGVSVLAALLLCDRDPDLKIKVYGFGTPACVDEQLAEACKGELSEKYGGDATKLPLLGSRVTVKNFINRDDLVPRLSVANAKRFVLDLKESRPRWEPLLRQDLVAFTKRAQTLWAPPARTRNVGNNPTVTSDRHLSKVSAAGVRSRLSIDQEMGRLVPPGIIVHSFSYRGTTKASLVDYRFDGLRRIEALPNMVADHRQGQVLESLRNIRAVRQAVQQGRMPPVWQSIPVAPSDPHAPSGGAMSEGRSVSSTQFSTCVVCRFFVGWGHTGDSETVEVRGTNHCYACGCIVCSSCSTHRRSLPEIGILQPVRVCDDCNYKICLQSVANVGSNGLDVGAFNNW